MERVTPKVFLIGETRVIQPNLDAFLSHIGANNWVTDAPSDSEQIAEIMGRICYNSFVPGMNPNVTKVRNGNESYLGNIINQEHGSVLEHGLLNFIFVDVSRVFTHELVRHRVGVGISQQSLRYVRLDKLGMWAPTVIEENEDAMKIFTEAFSYLEGLQLKLADLFHLDDPEVSFHFKKLVTSAMRRIAPIGLATVIGWSTNLRTMRWVLENRTQPAAEEEIRYVFGKVGEIVLQRYPNAFQDFQIQIVDGFPWYKPKFSKI